MEAQREIKELKKQMKEKDELIVSLRQSSRGNILSFHSNKSHN